MTPEKRQLIHDLLDDENRRETTLLAGARVLRRRRRWRVAGRGVVLTLAVAAAALWLEQRNSRPPSFQTAELGTKPPAPVQKRSLTDDELLALFPNTPVGLATLPDGRKLLIFPRLGDEKRFTTHL
jgi:hypothetical protein